jgi:3-phosphoshikimate 1-carboxyvinyltransferase
MSDVRFAPAGPLRGALVPPPDKSISHRAALIGAMADGQTRVSGYLDAADTRSTLAAVRALGAGVEERTADRRSAAGPDASVRESPATLELTIEGVGLRGPRAGRGADPLEIDVGNAGTLLRIVPGWLAGQEGGAWRLDGDESIRRRPVDRVAEPLRLMGAEVSCRDGRLPPLEVHGSELVGIRYEMPHASAQVKSCLLLAGLLAAGRTEVLEPAPCRDHTERMLRAAGVEVASEERSKIRLSTPPRRVAVGPAERLELGELQVPGDFSSAAFHLLAAILVPGSEVRLEGVGLNPTRIGLLGILNRMGAPVHADEGPPAGLEPRGTIVARAGALRATRVDAGEVPLAIDELPLVALAGCFAEGETVVAGAGELRHKESDRIAAVVDGLRGLGAEIEATEDGFAVRGAGGLRGGALDARGDHRLAMLGAVAGLASRQGVEVAGFDAAGISYPGFERDLGSLAG